MVYDLRKERYCFPRSEVKIEQMKMGNCGTLDMKISGRFSDDGNLSNVMTQNKNELRTILDQFYKKLTKKGTFLSKN